MQWIRKKSFAWAMMLPAMAGAFLSLLYAQTAGPSPTPAQAAPLHSVWDGIFTQKQAERGEALYQQLCSTCHNAKLTGGNADAAAPALTGQEFEEDWNGQTVAELFKQILRKMPQTDPGTLTPQQSADLVAFILSFNKFPAGKTELPPQAEALAGIRIDTKKPDGKKDNVQP